MKLVEGHCMFLHAANMLACRAVLHRGPMLLGSICVPAWLANAPIVLVAEDVADSCNLKHGTKLIFSLYVR